MFAVTVYGITRKFPANMTGQMAAAAWVANVKGKGGKRK